MWVGNALLAFVALPIVLLEAFRIIRSLQALAGVAGVTTGAVGAAR